MFDSLFQSLGLSGGRVVISAIVVFVICLIAIRVIMKAVEKLFARSKKMDTVLQGFLKTVVRIVLWMLAIVVVAGTLGIPTASLVAVISVAGLALSLSVQNILSNLFSGITLLITKPFGAGDLVDIGASTGTIRTIGLFYTVLDTLDKRVISIPNSDVTGAAVVNYSRNPLRRVDMTFNASYDDSTEAVRAAILEAAQADGRILADPAPFIVVSAYKDSSVEYIVRLWCRNADYWDVYFGMNERVRERFDANGVHMTYNHLNIHMIQ